MHEFGLSELLETLACKVASHILLNGFRLLYLLRIKHSSHLAQVVQRVSFCQSGDALTRHRFELAAILFPLLVSSIGSLNFDGFSTSPEGNQYQLLGLQINQALKHLSSFCQLAHLLNFCEGKEAFLNSLE